MVLGRGIFACGTQPFHTSRKYYLGKYFIGKEYLFASGLTISASRLASAVASPISAQIYICCGIIFALAVGEALVIISFILLIFFIIYDKSTSKKYTNLEKKPLLKSSAASETETGTKIKTESESEDERGFYLWESLKIFDRRFWILAFALATFYASYMTFTANQSSFLQARFGYEYESANDLAMIGFGIATFSAPVFGFICDKYGYKLLFLSVASVLLIAGHCILGFSDHESRVWPIVGLVSFGTAMSLGSAILWPMILLVCDKKYHASALGVSSVIDNGSQATSLVVAGALTRDYTGREHENTDQYEYFTYWVLLLAVMMLVFTIWLWVIDDDTLNGRPGMKEDGDGDVEERNTESQKVSMQEIERMGGDNHFDKGLVNDDIQLTEDIYVGDDNVGEQIKK